VGEYSGLVVERFNRGHPHNALERWLIPSAVAPNNDTGRGKTGLSIVWTER
jgi:hypothetical protein